MMKVRVVEHLSRGKLGDTGYGQEKREKVHIISQRSSIVGEFCQSIRSFCYCFSDPNKDDQQILCDNVSVGYG